MTKTFTDYDGDTLKIHNYGSNGAGDLTIQQSQRAATFGLTKTSRVDIAKEILDGADAILIEGPIPATEAYTYAGTKKVKTNGLTAEITHAELDYFLKSGRERLAIAFALKVELDKEAAERQERIAKANELKARRDKLAKEFGGAWVDYSSINLTSKLAIDRILELEDANK